MMLSVGSLFSGIGGFELGLERTGCFKTSWQCEKDPFCLKVLAKHWPDVKRFTDIKEMKEDIPYVDVICGGFPCQDISCAGKGAGIHAERSGLWWEAIRVIRMVRPRFVIVENVAALLNRGLDEVLGSLAESGYDAEWQILSAAMFGAPHLRQRCFILAYPAGIRCNGYTEITGGIREGKKERWMPEFAGSCDVSDAMQPGLPFSECKRKFCGPITKRDWGQAPPAVCGVDDGVSRRVDRLRALGNAIVPQCAEFVGRCLLDSIQEVPA